MKRLIIAATLALSVGTAHADGMVTYETQDSFEDVVFGLENAILDLGLVVDHVSHTGEMLERTIQGHHSFSDLRYLMGGSLPARSQLSA